MRDQEERQWYNGFATALAETHRLLVGGNDSTGIRKIAKAAGLTINVAWECGVSVANLNELRRAGVS